jgi:ankyrin repeat protein
MTNYLSSRIGRFAAACECGDISEVYENWCQLDWANMGLEQACKGGQVKIAELMLSRAATAVNRGLYQACNNGHVKAVELMLKHGANNFDSGFSAACYNNHKDIMNIMLMKGARECWCGRPVVLHQL